MYAAPNEGGNDLQIKCHFRITHEPNKSKKMPSVQETVEAKIAATPVVVYSKSYCPYCTKTKALLKEIGASFDVIELDQVDDGDAQQSALEAITGKLFCWIVSLCMLCYADACRFCCGYGVQVNARCQTRSSVARPSVATRTSKSSTRTTSLCKS